MVSQEVALAPSFPPNPGCPCSRTSDSSPSLFSVDELFRLQLHAFLFILNTLRQLKPTLFVGGFIGKMVTS